MEDKTLQKIIERKAELVARKEEIKQLVKEKIQAAEVQLEKINETSKQGE